MNVRRGTAILLAVLLASPAAVAQVYRWVDENGVTHLSSEKPPAGVKAERIDIKTSGSSKRSSSGTGSRSASGSNQPAPRPASPHGERPRRPSDGLGKLGFSRRCQHRGASCLLWAKNIPGSAEGAGQRPERALRLRQRPGAPGAGRRP